MIKSNEFTIEQMNEAIAIFDGWEFVKGDPTHKCNFCFAGDEPCTPAIDRFIKGSRTVFHYELQYHTSLDWLMPVWTKFRQLMKPGSNDMFDEWVNSLGYYLLSSERPDRFCERLYYAIQWYQNQTTTNER